MHTCTHAHAHTCTCTCTCTCCVHVHVHVHVHVNLHVHVHLHVHMHMHMCMWLQAPLWAAAMADGRPHVAAALLRSLLLAAPFTPHHVRYLVITPLLLAAPFTPQHARAAAQQAHAHVHLHAHAQCMCIATWHPGCNLRSGAGCSPMCARRGCCARCWACACSPPRPGPRLPTRSVAASGRCSSR